MIRKKFMAVAMSAVLAVSLCPGLAMADSLTGAAADLSGSSAPAKTVTTQGKTTVYVLTGTNGYSNGYTYNSNGLLTSSGSYTYSYKGINLKSIKTSWGDTYTVRSKKGMPVSASHKESSSKYVYKYGRDKKGNLTNAKTMNYGKSYGGKTFKKLKKTSTTTTQYKLNKKGRIVKSTSTGKELDKSGWFGAPYTYKYDKKGNLKTRTYPYQYSKTTYSYKYKGGHATSRTYKYKYSDGDSYSYTTTLTYTKKTVPSKYAKVVKAQQWALLNGNLNCAFGPYGPGLGSYYD